MAGTPTVHLVHNATELKTAFSAAVDGDRIELAAGAVIDSYVRLKDEKFSTGVTITSQDPNNPGVFTAGLELFQVSNVTITDVDFRFDSFPSVDALFVRGSDHITLQNLDFDGYVPTAADGVDPYDPATKGNDPIIGYGSGRGLRILNVDSLSVADVTMQDYNNAIRLEDLTNGDLTRLDLEGMRDGITFTDVIGLSITDSYIHDFKPWLVGSIKDHPDMIQYWGKYGTLGNHDVTIQGNVFEQSTGWTQTIFGEMRKSPPGITATDFHILDNIIINGQQNAVRLDGVDRVQIENNLFLPNAAGGNFPRIDLSYMTNYTLTGNVLTQGGVIGLGDSTTEALGNQLLSKTPTDPDYWGLVLQAWQQGAIAPLDTVPIIQQLSTLLSSNGTMASVAAAAPITDDTATDDGMSTDEDDDAALAAVFSGDSDDDILVAGPGESVLTGGSGSDHFIFLAADFAGARSKTVITDFMSGEDVIELHGFTVPAFDALATGLGGTDTSADVDGVLELVISGVSPGMLQAGDVLLSSGTGMDLV